MYPTTPREALLKIAGRADLKRARANEMAALLFTMLFERAQRLSGGRLDEPAPTDDWRSIKAAARLLSGEHGADQKITQMPPHNQSTDTAAGNQSDAGTSEPGQQ